MNNDTQRMSRTVRDIIAQIDSVFARGVVNQDGDSGYWDARARSARQLWDVLSALRGPDNENREAKGATTAIIRAACFPKTFDRGNRHICIPATMDVDSETDRQARTEIHNAGHHFQHHVQKAFDVLGLKWREVNTPAEIAMAAMPFKAVKKLGKTAKRKSKSGMTRVVSKAEQKRCQKKSARS